MRTVDLLIAVRDLFADKTNWTIGALFEHNNSLGKNCFCALGGILKEGGCLEETKHNHRPNVTYFVPRSDASVQSNQGLGGVWVNGKFFSFRNIAEISQATLKRLGASGFHPVATANAVKYLAAAVRQTHPGLWDGESDILTNTRIARVNDNEGYDAIMKALDVAIRNAKRRHINGDRKKKTSSVQAVSL